MSSSDTARVTALRDSLAWQRRALAAEATVAALRADLAASTALLVRTATVLFATSKIRLHQPEPDILTAVRQACPTALADELADAMAALDGFQDD